MLEILKALIQTYQTIGILGLLSKIIRKVRGKIQPSSSHLLTNFVYPWDKMSLESRLARLINNKREAVVFIYHYPDYGTFRYRVYNIIQTLDKLNIPSTFFSEHELDKLLESDLKSVAKVVLVRTPWSRRIDKLITQCKKNHIKLSYDVDDLVFDTNYLPLLVDQISATDQEVDYWAGYIGLREIVIRRVDEVITTNNFLGEKIKEFVDMPVSVVPNYLNDEQHDISMSLIQKPKSPNHILGYFSGTKTHQADFNLIQKDIARLFAEYPTLQMHLVGFIDIDGDLKKYRDRITFIPLQNFVDLQKCIAAVTINLIPLVVNDFTNCKSELKFFEAAIVGIPSIASPTYVYNQVIKNGENGYLAADGEWYHKIKMLIDDSKSYSEIALKAQTYANDNYFGSKINKLVTKTYI